MFVIFLINQAPINQEVCFDLLFTTIFMITSHFELASEVHKMGLVLVGLVCKTGLFVK